MKRLILCFLLGACSLLAQYTIKPGSKIYVEKMANDLDGYITAEFVKQKVKLVVVLSPDEADYLLLGSGTEEQSRKWHSGWLTPEQDRTSGNIKVIEKATKSLVYAAEAGDRSLWWGTLSRGGQRKVASRLVEKLKGHVKEAK